MPMSGAERQRRWRERRAAEAEPSEPRERDEDEELAPAVRKTIEALDLAGQDAAAAQLAYVLAVAIDRADKPASALRWLGPELLKALESLGATPAARARMKPGSGKQQHAPSKLDELRAVRARRNGTTTPV